ncbi:hypothetical protein WB401_27225 [Streptomyces brasiliscabiei]|uniref:hypothetical protein n=1 Tax=Streptomyces brasiliscabiei TaxID=2736302 RepID=UPI003014C53A
MCQVAVHLTFASSAGHCLIGRRLRFIQQWAADEERREPTGVPRRAVLRHQAAARGGHAPCRRPAGLIRFLLPGRGGLWREGVAYRLRELGLDYVVRRAPTTRSPPAL